MASKNYTYICSSCNKAISLKNPKQSRGTICKPCNLGGNSYSKHHGQRDTRLYNIWRLMRSRCQYPKHIGYAYYGGRGITYCAEWESFVPFMEWATKNGYADNLQIDRIDNDGPYSPDNCRWVTAEINMQNRSIAKLTKENATEVKRLVKSGKTQTEVAKMFGVSFQLVNKIHLGLNWKNA